jgi:hypothetical protein
MHYRYVVLKQQENVVGIVGVGNANPWDAVFIGGLGFTLAQVANNYVKSGCYCDVGSRVVAGSL